MPSAPQRITVLSFRTFGDYVLKAPFLYELYRLYPGAEVTLLTNKKGAQVYPLLDSRLRVVTADHGMAKGKLLRTLRAIPRADTIYAIDDSRTTLMLSLLIRGSRRTGWVQGISQLYAEGEFREWRSVNPWLSRLVKMIFRPGLIRLPEDKHDAYVELELLGLASEGRPLAEYRGAFALPPAQRAAAPYLYCAAEAGWRARQLTTEQWIAVLRSLRAASPEHSILVHGAGDAVAALGDPRVQAYAGGSVRQLFETISAADLVIAPDSFALHTASLYGVPAIGYFGPAHPHRFRPTGPRSASLFHRPECSPCLQRRGEAPCQKGLAQCSSLAALAPEEFAAAARNALGRT